MMKIQFKHLFIAGAFFFALPTAAMANLNGIWNQTTCPLNVGAEDCSPDYINSAAPNPKTCATLSVMNQRNTNCNSTSGGTLRCSGVCFWTSSSTYCDGLNRNTTTVSEGPTSESDVNYNTPNLDVCGNCKAGYDDIDGDCIKAYTLNDQGGIWFAKDPLAPYDNVSLGIGGDGGSSVWTQVGNDAHYLAGNVGVGSDTPVANLHVGPDAGDNHSGTDLIVSDQAGGAPQIEFHDNDGDDFWIHVNNGRFYILPDGGAGNAWSSDRPFVVQDDKVGMGTATPEFPVHIHRAMDDFPANYDQLVYIRGNGAADSHDERVRGLKVHMHPSGSGWTSREVTGLDVEVRANSDNHAAVFRGGNVGIGTTSPGRPLHVKGHSELDGAIINQMNDTYDVWIQGGDSTSGGDSRNLAILGYDENDGDFLRINYQNEYAGGTRMDGKVRFSTGGDCEPENDWGAVMIGGDGGTNVCIDNNEIMARDDGGTSTLFLNNDGGEVETGGNLGVGTDPSYRLDVRRSIGNSFVAQVYNTSTSAGAYGLKIRVGRDLRGNPNYPGDVPVPANHFIEFFDGNNEAIGAIEGNGWSGGGVMTYLTYNSGSDGRLKENVETYTGALDKLMQTRPVEYNFIGKPGRNVGFIAQELQDIYPYAVSGDPNGDVKEDPMSVAYGFLTPLITAAVQELKMQHDAEIAELKALVCLDHPESKYCND